MYKRQVFGLLGLLAYLGGMSGVEMAIGFLGDALALLLPLGGKFFGLGLIGWLISFGYGSLIAGMWYGKLYSLLNTPILDLAARITRMATLFFPMAAANAASGPALTCLRSPSQHSNRTSYCTASDLAGSTPRLE